MADTYEKDLGQKSSLTTSDFIRVVGSDNVSYKQAVSGVANTITSTIAKTVSNNTSADGISAVGCYYGTWTNTPSGASASGYLIVLPHGSQGATYRKQIYTAHNTDEYYVRTMSGGTWSSWVKMPTRAEIDALTAVTEGTITSSHTLLTGQCKLAKVGKVVTLTMGMQFTSAVSNYSIIATLPSGFRPIAQVWSSFNNFNYDITSGGNVRAITSMSSGASVNISMTYITA